MARGYYTLTAAADPQTVCTDFEAEANVSACVVQGTIGEAETSVLVPTATVDIDNVSDWAAGDATIEYDTLVGELPNTFPFRMTVDSEIVKVTSYSATILTVERGVDGTVDAVHLDGATLTFVGDQLASPAHAVFRVTGTAVVDITNAATAVGGVEVASGYPAVA